MQTFREFLLSEDTSTQIAKLRADIARDEGVVGQAERQTSDRLKGIKARVAKWKDILARLLPAEAQANAKEVDQNKQAQQTQQTPPAPGQPHSAV